MSRRPPKRARVLSCFRAGNFGARCLRRPAALPLLAFALLAAALLPAQPGPKADARALYRQAEEARFAGDLPRAVELYRGALALNAAYLEPVVGLARTFFELEEYEEALRCAQEARRLDARDPDLAILEARACIAVNQWERAQALLSGVLAREPNNLEARFALAELEVVSGKSRSAASRYLDALRVAPENRKALLSLAVLREAEGSPAEAERYLELAVRAHSGDPEVHRAAGEFAARRGRLPAAERHLLTALSLKEDFPAARRALAGVYLSQGRVPDALALLREMIDPRRRGDPNDPRAQYLLGLAYRQGGDTANAASRLSEAVRLRPDDETARLALEEIALQELPLKDAVRRKAAAWRLERGRILESHNYLDKALFEYRRSLMLDPESREGRLAFARLFRVQGYPVKYLRELQVLRDLGYKDAEILDAIEITAGATAEGVAADWRVDQYALQPDKIRLGLFTIPARNTLLHRDADLYLARAAAGILRRNERLAVNEWPKDDTTPDAPGEDPRVPAFDRAFQWSRERGADYFLLLQVEESERSFSARMEIYRASTGSRLETIQVFRTGNDRIRDGLMRICSRLEGLLPVRGRLLAREFDTGIVDLGRMSGLQPGDKLAVVRSDRVQLAGDRLGLSWRPEDELGEFTVTRVDENLCEGRLAGRSFFDQINPEDAVLRPAAPPPPAAAAAEPGTGQGLLRRLFGLFK